MAGRVLVPSRELAPAPERAGAARLGRTSEAAAVRQRIFEDTLAVSDLHAWLEVLPPEEQGGAIERAGTLATAHADPVVVSRLLLDIGDDAGAEEALMAAPSLI